MYETLLDIAGPAILAWLLMIFAPKWRVTQWLVQRNRTRTSGGPLRDRIALLIGENGMGFMRDFGSTEGVTGLMARPEIALVAWIHFLVFDQLVGILRLPRQYASPLCADPDSVCHPVSDIHAWSRRLSFVLRDSIGALGTPGRAHGGDAGVTEAVASSAELGRSHSPRSFVAAGGE